MVWLKNLIQKILKKIRPSNEDPDKLLDERIKEMRKRDPFIYK